jgi:hypothetical protein
MVRPDLHKDTLFRVAEKLPDQPALGFVLGYGDYLFHDGTDLKLNGPVFKREGILCLQPILESSGLRQNFLSGPACRRRFSRGLIAEQFLQLFARGRFARVATALWRPFPEGKFKILTEIPDVLFQDRFGAAFPALLGNTRVVVGAVQADPQVGPAFHAGFATPRLGAQRPRFAAIMTMSVHLRFWIFDLRRTFAQD